VRKDSPVACLSLQCSSEACEERTLSLSIHLSIYSFVYIPIYLSIHLSIYLSTDPSIYLFVYLSYQDIGDGKVGAEDVQR